jgi:hypothetical protein
LLTTQIGLLDQTGTIDPGQMAAAAAALSIQVMRDLSQFWPVSATVQALPAAGGVPPGCVPVYIVSNLQPGQTGVHLSTNNQPYANVEAGNGWMLAASHEICELLVDPSTNKLHAATAIALDGDGNIIDGAGQFDYLVEVCDPSESPDNGYLINAVPVADFYTPHYFDAASVPSVRYSFTGAIKGPRQVLPGGYLTWHDPVQGIWQQLDYVNYNPPQIVPVDGPASNARSLREHVDGRMATTRRLSALAPDHPLLKRAAERGRITHLAAAENARRYGAPGATAKPARKKNK